MLYEDIINGKYDAELEAINTAVTSRGKIARQIASLSTPLNSRVRTKNLSPKKLSGLTGTLVRREGSAYVLRMDLTDGQKWLLGRYLRGADKNELWVPVGTFEKME